jgi:hypothetical protein
MTLDVAIVAGEYFTTGSVDKRLVAVRWSAGDAWYVAAAGQAPEQHDTEADAVRAFLIALGLTSKGASA